MEKLLQVLGVLLLLVALAALAIYGWHGQWRAVAVALVFLFAGKLVLGFIELLLSPFALPALYFARRGQPHLSTAFYGLSVLATRALYASYCIVIAVALVRTPGPPPWMAVVLAVMVASMPFNWAAQRAAAPVANIDLIASMAGTAACGALYMSGVPLLLAALPIVLLFLVSATIAMFWWGSVGVRQSQA